VRKTPRCARLADGMSQCRSVEDSGIGTRLAGFHPGKPDARPRASEKETEHLLGVLVLRALSGIFGVFVGDRYAFESNSKPQSST